MNDAFLVGEPNSEVVIMAVFAADDTDIAPKVDGGIRAIEEATKDRPWLTWMILVDRRDEDGSSVVEVNGGRSRRIDALQFPELDVDAASTIERFLRWTRSRFGNRVRDFHLLLRAHGDGVNELVPAAWWSSADIGAELKGILRKQLAGTVLTEKEDKLFERLDDVHTVTMGTAAFAGAVRRGLEGQKLGALVLDSCFAGSFEALCEMKGLAELTVAPEFSIHIDAFPYARWLATLVHGDRASAVTGKIIEAYESADHELTCFGDPGDVEESFAGLVAALRSRAPAADWVPDAVKSSHYEDTNHFCDFGSLLSFLRDHRPGGIDAHAVDKVSDALARLRRRGKPGRTSGASILLPDLEIGPPLLPNYGQLAFEKATGWYAYLTGNR